MRLLRPVKGHLAPKRFWLRLSPAQSTSLLSGVCLPHLRVGHHHIQRLKDPTPLRLSLQPYLSLYIERETATPGLRVPFDQVTFTSCIFLHPPERHRVTATPVRPSTLSRDASASARSAARRICRAREVSGDLSVVANTTRKNAIAFE